MLKLACPRCKRECLENEVLPEDQKGKRPPKTRCANCGAEWPSFVEAFKEVQAAGKFSLDNVEGLLRKAKAYVRGGRNVASRLRTAKRKIGNAAVALRHAGEEGALDSAGADLEGALASLLGGISDIRTAKKGEEAPLADEAEDEKDADG
jgi:hypothetical protein